LWYGPAYESERYLEQQLRFCPFTGKALPGSLRNRFFDEIEKLGLVDGLADIERAPAEFQSETWWIARGL
jgi:hypothetical protein